MVIDKDILTEGLGGHTVVEAHLGPRRQNKFCTHAIFHYSCRFIPVINLLGCNVSRMKRIFYRRVIRQIQEDEIKCKHVDNVAQHNNRVSAIFIGPFACQAKYSAT